ncbi:hypothetical protein Tco_0359489 [Tanacetum coccineum]
MVDILKKFDFTTLKAASTPIETNKALNKDEEAEDVDVHLYRSMIGSLMYLTTSRSDIMFAVCACASDYARASLDRKSTTGYCQFLGKSGYVLWIENQMLDYGFNFMNTKIHIDNESTICIVKNPMFHSKTKHIEIRHHFIRDSYEKKLIQVIKIHTDHNVVDLLTKAFDVSRKAKRTTKISQSSGPIHLVADETIYKEWEDRMKRAATTASSLEAEWDSGSGPMCQVTILGVQKLKLDGKVKLVSEAFIRRLKLEDSDGITTLPNTKIFEQLALMGSTVPIKSHHTPSGAPTTSQPPLSSPSRIPTRQETEVPQPSSPTYTNVADEAAFIRVDIVHRGATTTVSSIDVGQDSGNIPKSLIMPYDSPFLGVDSLKTELKQTKQTYDATLTKLIKNVKKLEQTIKTSQDRRRAKIVVSDDEESSEDTSKQGRMIKDIDQDVGISLVTPTKVSSQDDQSKDQLGVLSAAKVLTDAAKKNVNTYTRRRRAVSTSSEGVSTASRIFSTAEESVSTAGASMPVSTADMVQQVNIIIPSSSETTKDKGKAIMQKSEQPKKIKKSVQIQMSLDEELAQKLHEEEQARFNAEQEAKFNAEQEELLASETIKDKDNPPVADIDWDDVQAQIQVNEDLAQKRIEEEREHLSIEERAILLAKLIDKRKKLQAAQGYEAIRNKPQTMSQQRKTMCTYMENMAGYKMEHFKGKRFYEVKEMQKTGEGSKPTEKLKADEISQEDLQQIIMVVPVEEVYVEALQKFDRDDLDKLWSLVKERFSSTDPIDDQERTLWVELKRLFKPNTDDILWKLQRYMHDPLTWRLYDTCGVHHVSTDRGHDIFMLVEKDYPLTRGLLTLMLCNKLQVDQYSEMADELLRKIVNYKFKGGLLGIKGFYKFLLLVELSTAKRILSTASVIVSIASTKC